MVLNVVLDFPGLDREGLVYKIKEIYGEKNMHVMCMILDDIGENSRLSWILGELYCINEINGHFYLDKNLPPKGGYYQEAVKIILEGSLRLKASKEIQEHGENIIKPAE